MLAINQNAVEAAIHEIIGMHRSGCRLQDIWPRQFDSGLAWPDFDEGYGGLGLDREWRSEIWTRLADSGISHPRSNNFVGIGMAAELIHAYGSAEQRRNHLRSTFIGDHLWCQLFSEPGAGSDLANVATSAVRDG